LASAAQAFLYHMLESLTPVGGFQTARYIAFGIHCGNWLESQMVSHMESLHDMIRVLFHYHVIGDKAVERAELREAIQIFRIADLIFHPIMDVTSFLDHWQHSHANQKLMLNALGLA
jgi:hypothetical protein